jgi:hypothetical protein
MSAALGAVPLIGLSAPESWPLVRDFDSADDLFRAFAEGACAADDLLFEADDLLFAAGDLLLAAGDLLFAGVFRPEAGALLLVLCDLLRDEPEDLDRPLPRELPEPDDEERPLDLRLSAIPVATIAPLSGSRAT